MRNRSLKAFTLIEILIVVVILGILAAIVIPQFTQASTDAQRGNVQTQLQTIRNSIELFRVRNNGSFPAFPYTAGNGWGDSAGTTPAARGLMGPDYLRDQPLNPRTNSTSLVTGTDHTSSTSAGWVWNATSSRLFAAQYNETTKKFVGEP